MALDETLMAEVWGRGCSVGKLVGLPLLVGSRSSTHARCRGRTQGRPWRATRAERARGVAMKWNWAHEKLQGAKTRAAGAAGAADAAADGNGG